MCVVSFFSPARCPNTDCPSNLQRCPCISRPTYATLMYSTMDLTTHTALYAKILRAHLRPNTKYMRQKCLCENGTCVTQQPCPDLSWLRDCGFIIRISTADGPCFAVYCLVTLCTPSYRSFIDDWCPCEGKETSIIKWMGAFGGVGCMSVLTSAVLWCFGLDNLAGWLLDLVIDGAYLYAEQHNESIPIRSH